MYTKILFKVDSVIFCVLEREKNTFTNYSSLTFTRH